MLRLLPFIALLAALPALALAHDMSVSEARGDFDAESARIHAGDTIVFTNNDKVVHNIQIVNDKGNTDDKGLQKPGQDLRVTFFEPGTYQIHCGLHPNMKLPVVVK